ncbi:hypothetical protein CVT25_014612 [Psilocybe cyanescens]|uniref:Uncharacterized protein n=1 Tax=Psilocybe cyanescens TaxID=93625 RepID=A0A409WUD4_PSICY|nr:hypothetical protein CVT25_014612 [Psilocybe cyanescens]
MPVIRMGTSRNGPGAGKKRKKYANNTMRETTHEDIDEIHIKNEATANHARKLPHPHNTPPELNKPSTQRPRKPHPYITLRKLE